MTAPRPVSITDLHRALDASRRSLSEMLRHSCVADSAPEDKDGDDHEAESRARQTIKLLDEVIDPAELPAQGGDYDMRTMETVCSADHNKYVGKCPYCHQTL